MTNELVIVQKELYRIILFGKYNFIIILINISIVYSITNNIYKLYT